MSGTNRQSTVQSGGRHPSSTVDSQLAHLESVVGYMTQRGASRDAARVFDHGYWEQRVRALEATYELLISQRQRAAKLIEQLDRVARANVSPKVAA